MKKILRAIAGFVALIASAAEARKPDGVVAHPTPPAALSPTKAYLLYRASTAKSGLFPITQALVRIPTEQETLAYKAARQAAYDKALPKLRKKAKDSPVQPIEQFTFDYKGTTNAFGLTSSDFIEDGEMRSYLLEVPPGTYVFYGITLNGGGVVTCNCLGTVKFNANPGVLTFLGSLYADKVHKPSPVPNLEDNLGEQMAQYSFIFGAAVIPADESTPAPSAVSKFPIRRAEYSAVASFREPGAQSINRLAPIPGILGYNRGQVIDLKSGEAAK
jgi:hypothetical protein